MDQDVLEAPNLAQMQHWTRLIGLAQQMILERSADLTERALKYRSLEAHPNLDKIAEIQSTMAGRGMAIWEQFLARGTSGVEMPAGQTPADLDRRFADPRWRDNPVFDLLRQIYLLASEYLLQLAESVDGLDTLEKEKLPAKEIEQLIAKARAQWSVLECREVERSLDRAGAVVARDVLDAGVPRSDECMGADLESGRCQCAHSRCMDICCPAGWVCAHSGAKQSKCLRPPK